MTSLLIINRVKPHNFSALQRIFGFAEHLAALGYNIHILDCEQSPAITYPDIVKRHCHIHSLKDPHRMPRLANCDVESPFIWHKTKALYNLLASNLIADLHSGWTKAAIRKAQDIIKDHNISCILSTFAPIAPHMVAMALKEKDPRLIWIADMRDEYSTAPFLSAIGKKITRNIENKIIRKADALTTISMPILNEFKNLHPDVSIRYEEIRNGFNHTPLPRSRERGDIFKIVFIGSLFGDQSPKNFFKALSDLSVKMPEARFEIVGNNQHVPIPEQLKSLVVKIPAVLPQKADEMMRDSDLLLLLVPDNGRKGVYTGKLFQYLASGTPILGLVPPNEVAAELIKKTNTGYIAKNEDISYIKEQLLKAYHDWKNGTYPKPDTREVAKCHRKYQVQKLNALIKDLIQSQSKNF